MSWCTGGGGTEGGGRDEGQGTLWHLGEALKASSQAGTETVLGWG